MRRALANQSSFFSPDNTCPKVRTKRMRNPWPCKAQKGRLTGTGMIEFTKSEKRELRRLAGEAYKAEMEKEVANWLCRRSQ